MGNPIIEELKQYLKLPFPEHQLAFMRQRLNDAKPVKCVPIKEVFTPKEIQAIKSRINPKAKECYKNALLLSCMFPDKCKYVEGYAWAICTGTEHGFNRVGDQYVDITFELALNEDVTPLPYVSLIEANAIDVLLDVEEHNNTTGEYYQHKYIESLER